MPNRTKSTIYFLVHFFCYCSIYFGSKISLYFFIEYNFGKSAFTQTHTHITTTSHFFIKPQNRKLNRNWLELSIEFIEEECVYLCVSHSLAFENLVVALFFKYFRGPLFAHHSHQIYENLPPKHMGSLNFIEVFKRKTKPSPPLSFFSKSCLFSGSPIWAITL